MSDLISRDLAIKTMMALEAEDIADYGCSIPEGFDGKRASDALKKIPSEEPEIIRCKDCKYWRKRFPVCTRINKFGYGVTDFCSKAERKEVEDE